MRFDKLTIKSQEALSEAQSLATSRGHSQLVPAHLLRALLDQPAGSTIPVLQKLGVALDPLQQQIETLLEAIPKVTGGSQPQIGSELSQVLDKAFEQQESAASTPVDVQVLRHLPFLSVLIGKHQVGVGTTRGRDAVQNQPV